MSSRDEMEAVKGGAGEEAVRAEAWRGRGGLVDCSGW